MTVQIVGPITGGDTNAMKTELEAVSVTSSDVVMVHEHNGAIYYTIVKA